MVRFRLGLTLAACLATLSAAGCGGSATHRARTSERVRSVTPPSPCTPAARRAMAGFLRASASGITQVASSGNNAMPQCTFSMGPTDRRSIAVTANVDASPQPYFRLERTAIETGQELIGRSTPTPKPVNGIGVEAYWFPAQTELMCTDGVRLITVSVNWPAASTRRRLALALAVARPYLRPVISPTSPSLFKGQPAPP